MCMYINVYVWGPKSYPRRMVMQGIVTKYVKKKSKKFGEERTREKEGKSKRDRQKNDEKARVEYGECDIGIRNEEEVRKEDGKNVRE